MGSSRVDYIAFHSPPCRLTARKVLSERIRQSPQIGKTITRPQRVERQRHSQRHYAAMGVKLMSWSSEPGTAV
jgi:hypothetical protein